MNENRPFELLDRSQIAAKAAELERGGYRLVQMCATIAGDNLEVLYSFDKNYEFLNFRVLVPRNDLTIPSITESYLGAFGYENEMKELFRLNVTGLKLDYNGHFLRSKLRFEFAEAPKPAASTPAS